MSIQVRKLTEHDAEIFFKLRLESLQDSPSSYLSSYSEEVEMGKEFYIKNIFKNPSDLNVILGAFSGDALIGIIGIYQGTRAKVSHQSVIWGMYINPGLRQKGIGKSLMAEVILHAKSKMSCQLIKISVEENNFPAINLYKSFDFETWGIEPMALKLGEKLHNEIHMMLRI